MRTAWLLVGTLGVLNLSAADLNALRNRSACARGGPDGYGYSYQSTQDYGDTVHYQWIDASAGTPVTGWSPNPDDGFAALTLPFPFPFYAETLTAINVCSNGFLSSSATVLYQNTALPAGDVNNLIAGFWDDLALSRGGTIYQYTAPGNSAFVVQFSAVCRYDPPYPAQTFQFVLYPDGRIRLNYRTVTGNLASNTIGIQGNTGSDGWYLQYVADGNPVSHVVRDSTSILFYPERYDRDVGADAVRSPGQYYAPGAHPPVVVRVRNYGRTNASFLVGGIVVNSIEPYDTVFRAVPVLVSALAPRDTALVFLGELGTAYSGTWRVKLFTELEADEQPANDTIRSLTTNSAPFGTQLDAWNLDLGAGFALAGITFADDSNRFYATLSDPNRIASFRPEDPPGTIRTEAFALASFYGNDVVWGIAYDSRRASFWVGHVEAGGNGTIVARYTRDGAFTGDTWNLHAVEPNGWFAGMDYRADCDQFLVTKVGGSNRMYQLDFARRTMVRFIPGAVNSYRACSYFPAGEPWLITGGWNQNRLYHLDTLGSTVGFIPLDSLADADVYQPLQPDPDSLVYLLATLSNQGNSIRKLSLGFTWRQLGISSPSDPPVVSPALVVTCPSPQANPVRVTAFLSRPARVKVALFDLTGRPRAVLDLGEHSSGPVNAVFSEKLPPGAYFIAGQAGTGRPEQKLIVVR